MSRQDSRRQSDARICSLYKTRRQNSERKKSMITTLYCPGPECKKKQPHKTVGPAMNDAFGTETQAMECCTCGTVTNVPTEDFQANIDTDDGSTEI